MLVTTIEEIKQFLPVSKSLKLDIIKPSLNDAERIIEETIGSGFYAELDIYNANPTPENLYFEKLITKLKDSISFLAFHIGFDDLNTIISNQGIHRIENDEDGIKALFQRQEENLKTNYKVKGYNKLDLALQFLEANKAQFATWAASEEYTLAKSNFINSAKKFSSIYNINNNRLFFLKLRNFQALVEDFDIKPLIGHQLFAQLKTEIASDSLTAENKALVDYIQKAVAYRSIYRGNVQLITDVNEYGFFQKELEKSEKNIKTQAPVKESLLDKLLSNAEYIGNSYLRSIESFLKSNLASYPLFENSTAYDDTGSVFDIDINSKVVTI